MYCIHVFVYISYICIYLCISLQYPAMAGSWGIHRLLDEWLVAFGIRMVEWVWVFANGCHACWTSCLHVLLPLQCICDRNPWSKIASSHFRVWVLDASQTVKWTGRDVANGVYILLDILTSDVYCYGHLWPDSCSLSALLGCEHLTPFLSSFRRFCWMWFLQGAAGSIVR